jgi:hypothetical protein
MTWWLEALPCCPHIPVNLIIGCAIKMNGDWDMIASMKIITNRIA